MGEEQPPGNSHIFVQKHGTDIKQRNNAYQFDKAS